MADLLAATDYKIPSLRRGQEVSGKVVLVTPAEILIDIGAKSEGIVAGREFTEARDIISSMKVGDSLDATVLYPENDAGQVVLSLTKLSSGKRWDELENKKRDNEEIEVRALEANRGGLICEFAGLRGFLPASLLALASSPPLSGQAGQAQSVKIEDLVGSTLSVRVVEADRATNRLIFSQKLPGKRDLDALLKKLAKVKIGEKYQGTVSAVLPFGIFVEIDVKGTTGTKSTKGIKSSSEKAPGIRDTLDTPDTHKVEGLVHISEISWEKVEDVAKSFKVGDRVEVMVTNCDMTTGRLNLSIRQLMADPFAKAAEKYAKDQKVRGRVSRVTPYGVFVTLSAGIEGLMHNSKIPPNLTLAAGEEVECEIEAVDVIGRKISLVPIIKEKPILYR